MRALRTRLTPVTPLDTRPAAESSRILAQRAAPARARKRLLYRRYLGRAAVASDGLLLTVMAFVVAAAFGLDLLAASTLSAAPFIALPLAIVAGVARAGGYRFRYSGGAFRRLARTLLGAAAGAGIVVLAGSFLAVADGAHLLRLALLEVALLAGLHVHYQAALHLLGREGWLSDNVIIVGATRSAARIVERNAAEREINILGYFDDRASRSPQSMGETAYLGGIDELLSWPRLPEADRIVITVPFAAQARVRDLISRLRTLPQEVILVLDLEGFTPEETSLARVLDAPAAYVSGAPRRLGYETAKRLMDVVGASLLGLAALPVMGLIALAIKADSKGPVFFRQKRHGFNNEIIRVWKFRTMRPDRLAEDGVIVQTLPCDPRVTRVGRFLRATSLDELPQLLNVLAGEMSLVGPRPHAIGMTAGATEVGRSVAEYAHRHRAKPGITGWAQINGSRGPAHTQEQVRERVRFDLDYLKRATVLFDLYILAMTIPSLIAGRRKAR